MSGLDKPVYSTWIRRQKIVLFWSLSLGIGAVAVGLGFLWVPLFAVGLLALPFLYIAVVITQAAYRFSPRGGDFQGRIHRLLADHLVPRGGVLDIGCGSGKLIIQVAKRFQGNHIGLDFWGQDWEYSREQCVHNARLEGTTVEFIRASASSLPFETGTVENVVSCLTFHEVQDAQPRVHAVLEALRVLKPGGRFAFFDLFADPGFYESVDSVVGAIEGASGTVNVAVAYPRVERLPFPLGTAKVLGKAVLIVGTKS